MPIKFNRDYKAIQLTYHENTDGPSWLSEIPKFDNNFSTIDDAIDFLEKEIIPKLKPGRDLDAFGYCITSSTLWSYKQA